MKTMTKDHWQEVIDEVVGRIGEMQDLVTRLHKIRDDVRGLVPRGTRQSLDPVPAKPAIKRGGRPKGSKNAPKVLDVPRVPILAPNPAALKPVQAPAALSAAPAGEMIDPGERGALIDLMRETIKGWPAGKVFTRADMIDTIKHRVNAWSDSTEAKVGLNLWTLAEAGGPLTKKGFGTMAEFTVAAGK